MYENEKVISFSKLDDVQEFVNAASKCDFEIDVKYNRTVLDAKSFVGILGIGLKKEFKVCYAGNDEEFENVIDKLASA